MLAAVAWLGAMPLSAPAQQDEGNQGADAAREERLEDVDWSQVLSQVQGFPGVKLFDMPRVLTQSRLIAELAQEGDAEAALRVLRAMIARYPYVSDFHATEALLLAANGDLPGAFEALDHALDLGYQQIGQIRRTAAYSRFTDTNGFREVAAKPRNPPVFPVPLAKAALIESQTGLVTQENVSWDQANGVLRARFAFPDSLQNRSPMGDARRVRDELKTLILRGRAAGLAGVLYDNRDGDHSTLRREDYPRLTFVEYGEAAQQRRLHWGLAEHMVFNATTFGNSSTAQTAGPFWRSQGRSALTEPGGPTQLNVLFRLNHLYVYPEHRDHDPTATGGKGDLFPANTPFFLVSQGSSGSDRAHLNAVAHILAALPPDTRTSLEARGLIAPTVQMIYRRGRQGIDDDPERYMSGAAHPSVFDRESIDLGRMVQIAQRLKPETAPPAAGIEILQDWDSTPGRDVFGNGLGETLFQTPYAIGRVWRSTQQRRSLLLRGRADGAFEPDAVTYEWRVLRGDPDLITLEPGGAQGEVARLELDWHAPYALPDGMRTNRVDIAVFARNGTEISTPAILSILFAPRQRRVMEGEGPTARLGTIDFAPADTATAYADPLIFPRRRWSDAILYDSEGERDGWIRRYDDGRPDEIYIEQGFVMLDRDSRGRALAVETVDYPTRRGPDGVLVVEPRRTGDRFRIVYTEDEATNGILVPLVEEESQ
ncbi:MAG: bacterial transcriptional activator domain-containing protein [Pseudomonadota bacterium]